MGRHYPMDSDTVVVLQDKEIAMSRYIDAEYVIRKYINTDIKKFNNSDVRIVFENLKQNILKAPSIDIVRCKECRYCKKKRGTFKGEPITFYRCEENNRDVESDDYCSWGEREGE